MMRKTSHFYFAPEGGLLEKARNENYINISVRHQRKITRNKFYEKKERKLIPLTVFILIIAVKLFQ